MWVTITYALLETLTNTYVKSGKPFPAKFSPSAAAVFRLLWAAHFWQIITPLCILAATEM